MHMQDSEVHIARHLSAKEKTRLEEEAAEEAARAKANAGNDMTARALKQMMNGTPTGNVGPANQAKLSQPTWMKGDPSSFTPEQQQEVTYSGRTLPHVLHLMVPSLAISWSPPLPSYGPLPCQVMVPSLASLWSPPLPFYGPLPCQFMVPSLAICCNICLGMSAQAAMCL